MGYNCCFFLNFVPLHIESPYNFGGKKPSAEGKWACCISWRPVLVVEEAGVHGENHRPWASNW
jgi:hypothetical protein